MSANRPRIAIVEDDPGLRAYLAKLIDASADFDLAMAAGTLAEAREQRSNGEPDLYLVDLNLPDGSGVDLIREIKRDASAKALVLSVLGDRVTVMQALGAGADGYILKSGRPRTIFREIQAALDGHAPISAQIAAYLIELVRSPVTDHKNPGGGDVPELTDREIELLELFTRGLTYREAADVLTVSVNTVSDHVRKIYSKLSVHSRSEAVFEAQTLGLIGPTDKVRSESPPE